MNRGQREKLLKLHEISRELKRLGKESPAAAEDVDAANEALGRAAVAIYKGGEE